MRKKGRLIYGVGINDAEFPITRAAYGDEGSTKRKKLPLYTAWHDMLRRCYCGKSQAVNKTYLGKYVAPEWFSFMSFYNWALPRYTEGLALDKDLLVIGAKYYSPETCCFVPQRVNNIFTNTTKGSSRTLPLGVSFCTTAANGGQIAKPYSCALACAVGNNRNTNWIGNFSTKEEAHRAWQLAKADNIEHLVTWWQFDASVNHSFSQDVATALWRRCELLRGDADNGRETTALH